MKNEFDEKEVFEQQKLSIRRVIDVNTQETTTRLLAYQYYGSSELGSDIADLNQTINLSNIKGDVKVFTE